MAKIARQLIIGDYAKWRAGFDKAAAFREKAGMKNVQISRDVDNPTAVLNWSDVYDLAKARQHELRVAPNRKGWRCKGHPSVTVPGTSNRCNKPERLSE